MLAYSLTKIHTNTYAFKIIAADILSGADTGFQTRGGGVLSAFGQFRERGGGGGGRGAVRFRPIRCCPLSADSTSRGGGGGGRCCPRACEKQGF